MSIYDSYPPDQKDLAEKREAVKPQAKPKVDDGEIPYSKYMVSRPLTDKPFEKLLHNRR